MKSVLLFIALLSLGLACSPAGQGSGELPSTLRIGVLPDQSSDQLAERYSPLLDYLSDTLDISCELVPSDSYAALLEQFGRREVDLAYFGGVTFVEAYKSHGALPVVMRDIDRRFTSYILVSADSEAKELSDLKGSRFGFASKISTSGHFMPRYFLEQADIVPEDAFVSLGYLGKHDAVAIAIQDGTVDAGAADASVVDAMMSDGRIDPNRVRVLWETPAYVDRVWAIQPSFSRETVETIRSAFFTLSKRDDRQADILNRLRANYYLPATLDDYRRLTEIVEQLSLAEVQ